MARFLLVGVPRSGTSWTGSALGLAEGVTYVDEPDGFRDPFAFKVMLHHGENPAVSPSDDAPVYRALWSGAFAGGQEPGGARARIARAAFDRAGTEARRRARAGEGVSLALRLAAAAARPPAPAPRAQHVLVKSVQCARSVEWVAETFSPQVVVLERNPLNTLASWSELGFVRNARETADLLSYARSRWGVAAPPTDQLAMQAFVFGVLMTAIREAVARRPDWIVTSHDDLCVDAPAKLRALAERLGLVWTDAAERFVAESDRTGTGYATNRVASEQPDRWRDRLGSSEVDTIQRVLDMFPDWAQAAR